MSSRPRYFLVERYTPAVNATAVQEAAQRLAALDDATTRHVGTVLVAAEEICLSVFEAPDEQAVLAVNQRASFRLDRIVEVQWFDGGAPWFGEPRP